MRVKYLSFIPRIDIRSLKYLIEYQTKNYVEYLVIPLIKYLLNS